MSDRISPAHQLRLISTDSAAVQPILKIIDVLVFLQTD